MWSLPFVGTLSKEMHNANVTFGRLLNILTFLRNAIELVVCAISILL